MGMPKSEEFWRLSGRTANKAQNRNWRRAKAAWFGVDIGQPGRVPRFRTKRRFRGPRSTRSWIELGPELSRHTADLMESVAPALTEAFDDEMAPFATSVLNGLQELSGLAESSVQLTYQTDGRGTFKAQVKIAAPYALYIPGSPGNKLVFNKANALARRIRDRALDELAEV